MADSGPVIPTAPFGLSDIDTTGFAGQKVTFAQAHTGTLHAIDRGCHHAAAAQKGGKTVDVVVPADALATDWAPPRHCCGGWDVFGPFSAARTLAADWRTLEELRGVLTGTAVGPDRLLELLSEGRRMAATVTRGDDEAWQAHPPRPWEPVHPQRVQLGGWAAELVAASPTALSAASWLPTRLVEHLTVTLPLRELAARRRQRGSSSPAARAMVIACIDLDDGVYEDTPAQAAAAALLLAERAGEEAPTAPDGVDPQRVESIIDRWRRALSESEEGPDQIVVVQGRNLEPPVEEYRELLAYAFGLLEIGGTDGYRSSSYGYLVARLPASLSSVLGGRVARAKADPADDRRVIEALAAGLPATPGAAFSDPAEHAVLVDAANPRSLLARLADARAEIGVTAEPDAAVSAGQEIRVTATVTFTVTDASAVAAASKSALVDEFLAQLRNSDTSGDPAVPAFGRDAAHDFRVGLEALLLRAWPAPRLAGLEAGPVNVTLRAPS